MIKKNDNVKVIAGDHRGDEGRVLKVLSKEGKVIVEGINLVKKHSRGGRRGRAKGQIADKIMPMHISNVAKLS